MQIQAKITQNLDENLAKHNVKIDQFEEDIAPSDSEFGITDIELSDIEELQEERGGAQTTENENEEEEKLVDEAKILSQNTEETENVTAAPSEPSGSKEAATEENDKKKA